jgi:hypothetical protein
MTGRTESLAGKSQLYGFRPLQDLEFGECAKHRNLPHAGSIVAAAGVDHNMPQFRRYFD